MLRFSLLKILAFAVTVMVTVQSKAQVFQANNTSGCTPLGVVITVTSPVASSITSYAWQITTPSGTVMTASSAQYIAIFSQPGNYDVSLTINGSLTTTIQDYISVHALPEANFSVDDPSGCFPLCVNFSDISIVSDGNIVEWSWDFGDGGSSSIQNPSYCYNQVGNFTPVFSVEDEYGCFADITLPGMIHVVNNFPVIDFDLSSQLDCNPPVNIDMTNNSTGTSALTSHWDFGDGANQTVAGTGGVSHSFNTTGTFDVCLNMVDAIGCESEQCQELTVFNTAQAAFTVSQTTGCEGEVFTFTSTTTPTPPVIEWDFNNDGIVDSNNPTASYSYTDAGTYHPTLNVHYSSGCEDTESNAYTLQIIDGVNVAFVGDTLHACSYPFTVHFDNQSTGLGSISYQWFVDDVSVATTTDLVYTFTEYASYDIKLVATNAAGCETELLLSDYILVQLPTVDFDNGVSVCTDQNVPIFNVQVTSVDPVQFYFWDFNSDGTTDAEGLAPIFMFSSPGIFSITLTIETISGCTASYTNTQTINVLTQVDAAFTASSDTTCAGESVEFCVGYQPGNTFSWNFFDGAGWVIMPLDESCILHDYPDTGWFDLSLTVFNGACNVLQTFENFIYVQPPVAQFEYQVNCGDLSASFADISIEGDSIVWDFGDGSPLLINEHEPTHQFPESGTYTVTLAAYAVGSDCPDFQSADITVTAPNANMTFSPNNGCPPLDVGIHCEVFNPHWDVTVSNGDHITVDWNETAGYWSIHHTYNGGGANYAFSNPDYFWWPEVTIEEGGYFDVSVSTTDVNGCTANVLYDDVIHVSANPDFASFTTNTIDVCNSVNLGFQPDLQNLVSWQWIFSDGSISTSENPLHTFNPPYNYNAPMSATLTATDSMGCVSTVTQDLGIILPPVLDFVAASDPSCIGDAVQFNNFSVGPTGTTYSWDFGDPTSADNTSILDEPIHQFQHNGNYEVCLMADNLAGCVRTLCQIDAVHIVNPEVTFDYSSSINNCLYGVQFANTTSGTIVSSEWDFGDDQAGFGITAYHTYPIGVYDVTLTVINNFGCKDSLVVPDIFNYGNQIGPYTQVLDTAACAPFETQFSAFNPSDTYFQYFWDFNDGSGDPSGNTVTSHTYLQPGTYCPSIIMTDPNGCPVLVSCTDSIVVEEFTLNFNSPDYICFGDTLLLNIGNGSLYEWADLTSVSPTSVYNEFLLHPYDDSQFVVTGYYADCVRTDTINLEVKDLPIVTLDLVSAVCQYDSPFPLDQGVPNNPLGVYTVNGATETQFDPSWLASTDYEVVYTYTDTFQCVNAATDWVHIHPLPNVDFADLNDLCENDASISLNTATPSGGIYTLTGDTLVSFDPSVGYGQYEFIYTYTDINGCTEDDSSMLTVRPVPVNNIQFHDECLNIALDVQNLSNISEGNIASTTWDFGTIGIQTTFQPTNILFPSFGTQNFSLTSTSEYGCTATLDTLVYIHAVPEVHFSPDESCQLSEQVFYDNSTIAEDSLVTWIWLLDNQTITSPDSLAFTFNGWGEMPVQLTVISDFGCADSLLTTVSVHPTPIVDLQFEDGCFGVESHFLANSSIPIGGIVLEEWDFGDGHPIEPGAVVDNLYDSTGIFYIQYSAISNLGCITHIEDSIRIYAKPIVDFIIDPTTVCAGNPFSLMDLSTVDVPSEISLWTWWFDTDPISNEQNPEMNWQVPGTYDVTLNVVSSHGCEADSTILDGITVYPKPSAGFLATSEAWAYDPTIEITNTASEDVTTWYYDFGDDTAEIFPEGNHLYENPGNYSVHQTVSNVFGCRDTASLSIVIHPEMLVYIPNAFTPDNNGHNELFIPVINGFEVTYYEFKVFNRWGTKVFASNDMTEGWNGSFEGNMAEDGSYSWTLDIRSSTDVTIHRKMGNVMLLR